MGMSLGDLAVALVSLGASVVGSVCGIGGGIIIKPVLDVVSGLDVSTVNFLSGCTVLSMTAYSVARSASSGNGSLDLSRDTPLALGAAVGGLLGRWLFDVVRAGMVTPGAAGAVQAALLLVVTAASLVYTLVEGRVATREVAGVAPCIAIGLGLGACSSFLGIGGGPLNLVVLSFFFSLDTKRAAASSLYIIFFSQAVSTVVSLVAQDLSAVAPFTVVLMAACGIAGGAVGRRINARVDDRVVRWLFVALMVAIMGIDAANFVRFSSLG